VYKVVHRWTDEMGELVGGVDKRLLREMKGCLDRWMGGGGLRGLIASSLDRQKSR
jgi:hypothetical protein